jgi:catechol 2,3-dioxygenase-like lactoylglutathione lyase family enzyme
MPDLIKEMSHVAVRVPDMQAATAWATGVLGLRETARADGTVYLTHGVCHHSLQLIKSDRTALDHVAMEAHDGDALTHLIGRLRERGVDILAEEPLELGIARAVRFRGPEGHLFEVFVGMEEAGPIHTGRGVQPRRFGHPNLTCSDVRSTQSFLQDVLGFRLSDEIGDSTLAFLRCNPEHHGIGLQQGATGLNHYAWEVEGLPELGRLGDVLSRNDGRFIWGPGRHGAGDHVFTYHFDPSGCVVEYYADMRQIWDDDTYVPGNWSLEDHRGQNLWGPVTPTELLEASIPLADTDAAK